MERCAAATSSAADESLCIAPVPGGVRGMVETADETAEAVSKIVLGSGLDMVNASFPAGSHAHSRRAGSTAGT